MLSNFVHSTSTNKLIFKVFLLFSLEVEDIFDFDFVYVNFYYLIFQLTFQFLWKGDY